MMIRRYLHSSLAVALALMTTSLASCAASTTVISNHQTLTIVRHTETLNLSPGQTASRTASCAPGETLVSGGYTLVSSQPVAANTLVVLDSYPSDENGAPPSLQGQTETAWTMRATNPTTSAAIYAVNANCLSGLSTVKSAVWYKSFAQVDSVTYDDAISRQMCPSPRLGILTGGGFQLTGPTGALPYWGVVSALPSQENGVARKWWNVYAFGASGKQYVVCAQNLVPEPVVTTEDINSTASQRLDLSVSCPTDQVLVGGGYIQLYLKGGDVPFTTNSNGLGDLITWHAGYNATDATGAEVDGICVQAEPDPRIFITFSNYHHLLRIPADDITVATDGSGEVRASQVTARVSQAQSAPIDATRIIDPTTGLVSYVVPPRCGAPAPAIDAATTALKTALKSKVPAGQIAFGNPTVTLEQGTLTCAPVAGTSHTAPFTYVQAIDGSAAQSTYNPLDVSAYQQTQLQRAATRQGSAYILRNTLICPQGPKTVSATATSATVQCAAYGVAEWRWAPDALRALAQSLAGKSQDAAQRILDATPGIDPGSVMIDLPQGKTLPSDPNAIILTVVRPQDTAPVFRA